MSRATTSRCALWVVSLALASDAALATLPRVFFSPAERASISAARIAGRPLSAGPAADAAARPNTAAAVSLASPGASPPTGNGARARRIDGITVGRDAQRFAWIGGERIADGTRVGPYRVRVERDGVRLIAADGSTRRVAVGAELPP